MSQEFIKVNSKLSSADQQKLKMENLASELSARRNAEAKRLDEINNFKQQVLSLENELQELTDQGKIILSFNTKFIHFIDLLQFDLIFFSEGETVQQLREVNHQLEDLGRQESKVRQKKEAAAEEVRQLRNEKDGNSFTGFDR